MTMPPSSSQQPAWAAPVPAERTGGSGVLLSRAIAYLFDVLIVCVLSAVAWIGVWFFGLLTLGLGWFLLPAVGIVVAMLYAAVTIGGPRAATLGMRAMNLRVARVDGLPPDGLTAAAHCLLFYVATMTIGLAVLNVLIGLFRSDGRMGHDLLVGFTVFRT